MTLLTKVVLSPLPPTTNELTTQQRAHLVRKTKKIEQLLGSTPLLVDTESIASNPIQISLPSALSKCRISKNSQGSFDSTSSATSSSGSSRLRRRTNSMRSYAYSIHTIESPSTTSLSSHDNWSTLPMLRLSLKSEADPASSPPTRTSFVALGDSADFTESPTSSTEDFHSSSEDDHPYDGHGFVSPRVRVLSSPALPSSKLTARSVNTLRKQKMDRLRRKLGCDPPFELVFPSDGGSYDVGSAKSDVSPQSSEIQMSVSQVQKPVILKEEGSSSLPPSLSRKSLSRSVSSRDLASGHRPANFVPKQGSKTRRPRTAPSASSAHILEFRRVREKLSFIIENPDEHEVTSARNHSGPALSRASTKSSEDFQSDWYYSAAEAKGGWTSTLSTTFESKPTEIAPSKPISSPTSSPPSTFKKRPPSYRKPPPPIPDDINCL